MPKTNAKRRWILKGDFRGEAVAGRLSAIFILRREGELSLTLVDIVLRARSAPPIDVLTRYQIEILCDPLHKISYVPFRTLGKL